MQELYVDAEMIEIIGKPANRLPRRQYAQAVAVALVLRHSWRADDLAYILERLGISHEISLSQ